MKIEANNLQEAFSKAAKQLNCSVTELDIKVIQHPRGGVFGMFKKTAIIEATREGEAEQPKRERPPRKRRERNDRNDQKDRGDRKERPAKKEQQKQEPKAEAAKGNAEPAADGEAKPSSSKRRRNRRNRNRRKNKDVENTNIESVDQVREQEKVVAEKSVQDAPVIPTVQDDTPETLEIPYADLNMDAKEAPKVEEAKKAQPKRERPPRKPKEVTPKVEMSIALPAIEEGVTRLIKSSCFAIEEIKVEAFNDETVLIEFNGEDAALLIGKEGYRYKAFSYLLYNWVNIKFGLGIRLEIAEFLKNQEEMIDKYLVPVVERINSNGRGQTKPLDGVLIKIALERLRAQFPEKYVGIKSGREGGKFVVVNDFNRKNS